MTKRKRTSSERPPGAHPSKKKKKRPPDGPSLDDHSSIPTQCQNVNTELPVDQIVESPYIDTPVEPLSTSVQYSLTNTDVPITSASSQNTRTIADEDRLALLKDDERQLVKAMVQDHWLFKPDIATTLNRTLGQVKRQAKIIYRLLNVMTRYELISRYSKFFIN